MDNANTRTVESRLTPTKITDVMEEHFNHCYPFQESLDRSLLAFQTFIHQSWKLFKGTTSWPPGPTDPAKLPKKLYAFLMIRWARTLVDIGLDGGGWPRTGPSAVCEAFDDSSRAAIFAAGATERPRVTLLAVGRPVTVSVIPFSADWVSSITPLALTWKIALGLSVPMAPRNLNSLEFGSWM